MMTVRWVSPCDPWGPGEGDRVWRVKISGVWIMEWPPTLQVELLSKIQGFGFVREEKASSFLLNKGEYCLSFAYLYLGVKIGDTQPLSPPLKNPTQKRTTSCTILGEIPQIDHTLCILWYLQNGKCNDPRVLEPPAERYITGPKNIPYLCINFDPLRSLGDISESSSAKGPWKKVLNLTFPTKCVYNPQSLSNSREPPLAEWTHPWQAAPPQKKRKIQPKNGWRISNPENHWTLQQWGFDSFFVRLRKWISKDPSDLRSHDSGQIMISPT